MTTDNFFKCECHTHGLVVDIDNDNPEQSEFTFSVWKYGRQKLSFLQRLKYLFTGENEISNDFVILDIKRTTELSKLLTSSLDKINLEIKKNNSSVEGVKKFIDKVKENKSKIFNPKEITKKPSFTKPKKKNASTTYVMKDGNLEPKTESGIDIVIL